MIYKFNAFGHPNITATHKTTLEFTKDSVLSLKGDCIVGINADFKPDELRKFISKVKNKKILITIQAASNGSINEKITAEINNGFQSDKEIVVRKTGFLSERTLAVNSSKAAGDLSRQLVGFLQKNSNNVCVTLDAI